MGYICTWRVEIVCKISIMNNKSNKKVASILPYTALLVLSLLMSCGTYSSMQTARTLDQGTIELGVAYYRPSSIINSLKFIKNETFSHFKIGYVHVNGRYGITDKLDVGFNANTYGMFGLEGKYQLIGDHESLFALSVGANINTFFLYYYEYQIPVHMSIHPIENLGIYLTPKYAGQFVSAFGLANLAYMHYGGFSGGLMYGDRIKGGIDFTAMFPLRKIYGQDVFPNLYNIGIGVRWTIGGGGENKSDRSVNKGRKSSGRF